jgi:hypothetical protein
MKHQTKSSPLACLIRLNPIFKGEILTHTPNLSRTIQTSEKKQYKVTGRKALRTFQSSNEKRTAPHYFSCDVRILNKVEVLSLVPLFPLFHLLQRGNETKDFLETFGYSRLSGSPLCQVKEGLLFF